MNKIILFIILFTGFCFSQIESKLNGMNIQVHRGGSITGHNAGYNHVRDYISSKANDYGYNVTVSDVSSVSGLDAIFNSNNLWSLNNDGTGKRGNIDIIVLVQGEGDRTVGGGSSNTSSATGARERFDAINEHVKAGGGLIHVHASVGRAVTQQGWVFAGKLAGDWFHDGYRTPGANAGHWSAGTSANIQLDAETLESTDPSIFFIRKVMGESVANGGYNAPLTLTGARGEWYHFNGGKQNPDGTGSDINVGANNYQPRPIRGDVGLPSEGIGPSKVIMSASRIASYTPPHANGHHLVWGREVTNGTFDPNASATNGRYVLFQPGHQDPYFTNDNDWIGNLFFGTLRWMAKDDRGCTNAQAAEFDQLATVDDGSCVVRGCTNPGATNYDPFATEDDGSCILSIGLKTKQRLLGEMKKTSSSLMIPINSLNTHTINIVNSMGRIVFNSNGVGYTNYEVKNLSSGMYVIKIDVNGIPYTNSVSIK